MMTRALFGTNASVVPSAPPPSPSDDRLEIQMHRGHAVVIPTDENFGFVADQVRHELTARCQAIADKFPLVINLWRVKMLDASAVEMFAGLNAIRKSHGDELILTGLSEIVGQEIEKIQFDWPRFGSIGRIEPLSPALVGGTTSVTLSGKNSGRRKAAAAPPLSAAHLPSARSIV